MKWLTWWWKLFCLTSNPEKREALVRLSGASPFTALLPRLGGNWAGTVTLTVLRKRELLERLSLEASNVIYHPYWVRNTRDTSATRTSCEGTMPVLPPYLGTPGFPQCSLIPCWQLLMHLCS